MSSSGQAPVQFLQVGGQQLQVLQAPQTTMAQMQQKQLGTLTRTISGLSAQGQIQGLKGITQQPGTQLIQTLDGQTLLYQPTMVQADGSVQIPSGQVLTLPEVISKPHAQYVPNSSQVLQAQPAITETPEQTYVTSKPAPPAPSNAANNASNISSLSTSITPAKANSKASISISNTVAELPKNMEKPQVTSMIRGVLNG
jgi:hypothetical protein